MILKKIMVALLFVASTATFFSCSKQTSQVEPQTEVKNTIRHNKSTSQLAQILANDADFQASVEIAKTLDRQAYNYFVSLTQIQREAVAQAYRQNPTEENFISLIGVDVNQYRLRDEYFKKAIDNLINNNSLEGEDIGEIINQAYSLPWVIVGIILDCYQAYQKKHDEISGRVQSQKTSLSAGNAEHLDNRDAFFNCVLNWGN